MKFALPLLLFLSYYLPFHSISSHLLAQPNTLSNTFPAKIQNATITFFNDRQNIKMSSPILTERADKHWQMKMIQFEKSNIQGEHWYLTGQEAIINIKNNNSMIVGKVRGSSNVEELSSLKCETLILDDVNKKYYTTGFTEVITSNQQLTGNGIEYDVTKKQIRVPNNGKLVYNKRH